jgi:NitT/TauT family transport system permease protein
MKTGELLLFIIIISIFAIFLMGADVIEIPYFISKSLLRMICAYILTLIFSISFAILIAHNNTASKILFPIMDILQSIPILGFLPFAMLFFIHLFPVYGTELVSIFLLFTSMTWSVLFNTIEGIKTIPNKLSDVTKLTNVKGLN